MKIENLIKVDVDEITIFRTVNGKIAVQRSDKTRPSRYFNNIKEARAYATNKFNGKITEALEKK